MKCCALNHLRFVIVGIGSNGLRKLILISISLLIAGGLLADVKTKFLPAKDACDDPGFRTNYKSFCDNKAFCLGFFKKEYDSVLGTSVIKNWPTLEECISCRTHFRGSVSKQNVGQLLKNITIVNLCLPVY